MPEYLGWNAAITQDEVRDIVDLQIQVISKPCRIHVIYDGTMAKAKRYEALIPSLKRMGYKVFLVQLVIPETVSQQRVLNRYQSTGRYVSSSVVKDFYEHGAMVFRQLAPRADGSIQVDGLTGAVLWQQGEPLPTLPRPATKQSDPFQTDPTRHG